MQPKHILRAARFGLMSGAALSLAACQGEPLDYDMRGISGGFSTAQAATGPLAPRPAADSRGVISYPNYQVVVARGGDTIADVANRLGVDAAQLGRYNGIEQGVPLRQNEIIALPGRVTEPAQAPATAIGTTGITALAGSAIARAPAAPPVRTAALPPAGQASPAPAPSSSGTEPVRHRVERGETAYTISRLYNVPLKSLAEWNGLGPDFAVREGQFLLIPVARQSPPPRTTAAAPATATAAVPPAATVTRPGAGSPTPTPPSAAKPLPQDEPAKPVTATVEPPAKPVADVGKPTSSAKTTRMETPVLGSIIRGYSKGKNDGINIKAADGAPVKAAETGTVAAITKSAEGVPIVVVRHPDNLLTVYANVTAVSVAKGDRVARGQQIAKLRSGDESYVHFEVRNGFDSVDPTPYLN